MTKLVTIFGGSGFVGRYIAQRMAHAGWRVRVAVRRPNDAMFVRPYGVVGQVEPVFCNIRDDQSVRLVTAGADAVVNCVGILAEQGKNTFDALQADGAGRVARIAAEEGVTSMVHVSAIGADADAESDYARSKGEGEAVVMQAFPAAVILRPSIVFGAEDNFFNRFARMSRMSPFIPLFGADTKFQPVYVDDVAKAAEQALTVGAQPGIYELGGPNVSTFRELVQQMLDTVRRNRVILSLPFGIGRLMGRACDFGSRMTGGLVAAPVTQDQVLNLKNDNIVTGNVRTFQDLGIQPVSLEAVLPEYLWRFRPSGQYSDIKESASNLKG